MKTILVLSILFFLIALPVLGALTDADLDKIRLIVKEEVKSESIASENRMKAYVSQEIKTANATIAGEIKTVNTTIAGEIKTVNARIDGNDKRLSQIFWLIIALMGLIALPQIFIAWRSRKDRTLEKQIETLAQEIEMLKRQQIIQP